MRFPWLQVDADFIAAKAGDLGAHLGISRREALGLAIDLWTWALARASDDAPPDGMVVGTGPVPERLLSGAVGWTGPGEQLLVGLMEVGLLERVACGYRLTGFERYKSTWEKNRRRTGKKPEGNRTGTGGEPARKTQTQTHIEATASQETAPAASVADDIPQAADEDVQEADARPALVLSPPAEKPEALQAAWNQHAHPSLPRWQGMSEKRRRSAAARLRERPLAAWVGVIQRLSASSFCRGEEKGSSWRASPDWLLQPDVADKVLEGKYDRQAAPERHLGIAPPPGAPTAEDRRRAHQEYLAKLEAKKAGGAS